jgi:hypothetical protein
VLLWAPQVYDNSIHRIPPAIPAMVFRMCREAEIAKSRTAASPTQRRDKRFTRRYRDKAANDCAATGRRGSDIVLWRTVAPLFRFAISQNRSVSD